MKDFDRYRKEFYISTKGFALKDVLTHYQLPNEEDLHSMICGYGKSGEFGDIELSEIAESIDYFKYEKELWKQNK